MDDDQQFCLRWNNHQSTLVSVFDTLLEKGIHVDCTLAAEGQTLKAHKVVLSACSPYFENVLSQQYDKHPIIILKDVKYAELRAMMDYMYRGEVNISQDQLAALLKAAESLQIKGLSDNKPSRPPSRPAPPAAAHPPRAPTPQTQPRDGSVDSREGSVSPTRRRKKARRASSAGVTDNSNGDAHAHTHAHAHTPAEPPACKQEGAREQVEDLTNDEDNDDPPPVTHNDVVRNFQWHMERSQDEIMNSSDSVRDSQDKSGRIVTRSKKASEEPEKPEKVTTLAVLKTVKTSKLLATAPSPLAAQAKENTRAPSPVKPPPKPAPQLTTPTNPALERLNIFSSRRPPPCAQYKTEKGYKCPNCQRCYNARKNLVRHVTLECGIEPQYKCPHCSYRKHRRNELKKHMEKKHPDLRQDLPPTPGSPGSPGAASPLAVK